MDLYAGLAIVVVIGLIIILLIGRRVVISYKDVKVILNEQVQPVIESISTAVNHQDPSEPTMITMVSQIVSDVVDLRAEVVSVQNQVQLDQDRSRERFNRQDVAIESVQAIGMENARVIEQTRRKMESLHDDVAGVDRSVEDVKQAVLMHLTEHKRSREQDKRRD